MAVGILFPIQGPIRPEERQIGRRSAIDGLYKQCVERRQATLLLEERRVGKTSMAMAVLDRIRKNEAGWAIECDLSRGPIETSSQLADHLAEQARAAKIRIDPALAGARKLGVKVKGRINPEQLQKAGELLGLDQAEEVGAIASVVDGFLAPLEEGTPDLRTVITAIGAAALAVDQPAVIFIDEAQRLATKWNQEDGLRAQALLAELMESDQGNIVLLLAGSEKTAIEQLIAEGKPLYHDGMRFGVPEIGYEDWHAGLRERFSEGGMEISTEQLDQILGASGGHPQKTMRVCAHIEQLADEDHYEISEVLVDEAIKDAREHPSW